MTELIANVQFFSNRCDCISNYRKSTLNDKTLSFITSYVTFIQYLYSKVLSLNDDSDRIMKKYIHNIPTKNNLIVCFHGLNSHPIQFKRIIDELEKSNLSNFDIYIPKIIQRGNGKLDDMIQPIFEVISEWAKSDGDKQLILIGTSNGGRIGRAIEAKLTSNLDNLGNIKKIKSIYIVGACKGSSLADLGHNLHLSFLMTQNIKDEMPTNSRRSKQLNQEWENGFQICPDLERDYTFIASPHDIHVPNFDSTLMKVPSNINARYAIIKGQGHMSIVDTSSKIVSEIVFNK
jgi:hypothetical protein